MTARLSLYLAFCVGIGAIALAGWSLAHSGIGLVFARRPRSPPSQPARSTRPGPSPGPIPLGFPRVSEFYGVFLRGAPPTHSTCASPDDSPGSRSIRRPTCGPRERDPLGSLCHTPPPRLRLGRLPLGASAGSVPCGPDAFHPAVARGCPRGLQGHALRGRSLPTVRPGLIFSARSRLRGLPSSGSSPAPRAARSPWRAGRARSRCWDAARSGLGGPPLRPMGTPPRLH